MGADKTMIKDYGNYIEIDIIEDFDFDECLVYLNRSDIECTHRVKGREVYKLLKLESLFILIKIGEHDKKIRVDFLNVVPGGEVRMRIADYIIDMFDLKTDLTEFHKMAEKDDILCKLVNKYRGLRIIKINNFFEGICWAIIGQQINLKFAYTLKRRLVEKYGEKIVFNGEEYFSFPNPEEIAGLTVEDLRELQFTSKKAEYVIDISKLFVDGTVSREELENELDYNSIFNKLISLRGVGRWTADYVIMKCFNYNCAFPIGDAGLQNGLKEIMGRNEKPSIGEIEGLAVNWRGWEAYATFYIWRSL